MARRQGATEEQLDALARGEYALFEPSWTAAMRYADMLTPTPGIVSDPVYDELARHWSPEQIVEITAVICAFAFFNRFAHAMRVPPTA
ncbi:MAG: carboxymuconolactone decarboxylase family protein [Gemmatimonadaceae bacterium]|nr:carboxymuconolactone decarboxylase family protein [Gemmatimonadaceae bacterium]